MIGKTVAHYRILEKLGQGGMGVVYRAEDTRLGRSVALKALPVEFARDPVRRQRFVQEARAAAALSHAGIASVYALEEVGEELYIAFEYVKGQSLRALVTTGGLEQDTLLKMMSGIADALAAAHALGIVHRDLKPENILRTREGNTKILDFGLARFMPEQQEETASVRLTSAGTIVGTVSYMSPEQLEGKEPDFRSDVFSFGVMLYEMATGVRPFDGASSSSTISRILTAEPVPLIQRNPVAPPELDRIVRKCLRKRREERYQSTRDLAVDLQSLQRDSGTTASVAAVAATEDELSIFGRAVRLTHGSPRRWWEINNLFDIAGLAVMLYWSGQFREWIPGNRGTSLYFSLLIVAACVLSLRSFLLVSALFNPRGLAAELQRVGPWLRGAELVMFSLIAVIAAHLYAGHPTAAGFLLVITVGGFIVVLLAEPAMVRAAFPSSAAMALPDAKRAAQASFQRDQRVIVAIQFLYVLPATYGFFHAGAELQEIIQSLSTGSERWMPRTQEIIMLMAMCFLLVCIFASATVAIGIWLGRLGAVRAFDRWFYLFLFFDLPAMSGIIGVTVLLSNAAVAFLIFPILVALPFYQRELARRILSQGNAASGE